MFFFMTKKVGSPKESKEPSPLNPSFSRIFGEKKENDSPPRPFIADLQQGMQEEEEDE